MQTGIQEHLGVSWTYSEETSEKPSRYVFHVTSIHYCSWGDGFPHILKKKT